MKKSTSVICIVFAHAYGNTIYMLNERSARSQPEPEQQYLEFVVGKDGLKPDTNKVAAVAEWSRPTNITEVRQFLGMCNFFRKFVQGYGTGPFVA
jgi:hypothetical protein